MAHTPSQGQAQATTLKRSLTHGQMTMIVLGSALGTGLFLGSSGAIALAGPAVILAYAVGSLVAAIIAASTGEMAVRYPVRGGFGSIAGRYLGPYAGYLTRWAYWTVTAIITGIELVAVATYLQYWWPSLPLWVGIVLFGAVIVLLNIRSVKYFGTMEFFLSSIKVIALLLFVVVGLALVFVGFPGHEATGTGNLTNDGGFMPTGFHGVWLSLAVVMFSFGGIEMLSISAAEAKDPVRSVRASTKANMWRLATIYVVALFIVVSIIPWQSAAQLDGSVEASPFVLVFSEVGVPAIASITNFIILVAALSAANANLYAGTRLLHSLASEKMAPAPLARVSSGGIPVLAMWASTSGVVLAILLALFLPGQAFGLMMTLTMVCALTVWVLILLAYIAFKGVEGNSSDFRMWGGRITAGLGIFLLLAIWAALFARTGNAAPATMGIAYFLILTMIYFGVVKRVHTGHEDAFAEADAAVAAHSGDRG
ncbi:amino acid permease [Rothia nasimurium]|uniref:amino acid permease n=1 Tax=Rothia nasimurium TaxID=85336 RepID=UPI001F1729FE|nr:amino acid permease [Rothia nasimurium]